jgi:hypothetical protein
MQGSTNAKKKANSVAMKNALEFFVFGRAKTPSVKNSRCEPE